MAFAVRRHGVDSCSPRLSASCLHGMQRGYDASERSQPHTRAPALRSFMEGPARGILPPHLQNWVCRAERSSLPTPVLITHKRWALSGTGVEPATLIPASVTYTQRPLGTNSLPKTFTLANRQNVTLANIAIRDDGRLCRSGDDLHNKSNGRREMHNRRNLHANAGWNKDRTVERER